MREAGLWEADTSVLPALEWNLHCKHAPVRLPATNARKVCLKGGGTPATQDMPCFTWVVQRGPCGKECHVSRAAAGACPQAHAAAHATHAFKPPQMLLVQIQTFFPYFYPQHMASSSGMAE